MIIRFARISLHHETLPEAKRDRSPKKQGGVSVSRSEVRRNDRGLFSQAELADNALVTITIA